MNRFSDFLQTDFLHAANEPAKAADTAHEGATGHETTTATSKQPVPLAPQNTGVLPPISGGQIFLLVLFGIAAAIMVIAMTRYGSKNNYGD